MNNLAMDDGFRYNDFVADGWPKRITLRIPGPLCPASRSEIENGDYDTLWIDAEDSTGLEQLPRLRPELERLRIQSAGRIDVGWISDLTSLKSLQLHGKIAGAIDFDRLTSLQLADVDYCSTTSALLDSGIRPLQVSLHKLDRPLNDFPAEFCRGVTVLGLDRGPLISLDGLEEFESLKSLSVMDMRSLEDVRAVAHCRNLEELDVTSCNAIVDCTVIGSLDCLEWLVWENRKLDSLKQFLPGTSVEVLRLGERTEIEDGDTSIALELPRLKHVSFRDKRRYNRRVEELNAILAERNPEPFRTLAQRQLERIV